MLARHTRIIAPVAMVLSLALGGCLSGDEIEDILDELDDIEIELNGYFDDLQQDDPRDLLLPPPLEDRGDTIIINNNVTVINNIQEDIVVEELPDVTILGFENLTDLDAYYRYYADGELQGILVYSGETLLLEYPCLFDVELLSEDYFDPFTGELVEGFDIQDAFFENPFDFECGEAFIMTFTPDEIIVGAEAVDLLD